MIRRLAASVILVLMSACDSSAAPADARRLADLLTGDAKGSAAANPVCKLFSAKEASVYAGRKVQAGSNAAGGRGCQWDTGSDDAGRVMVQVVRLQDANPPSGAAGFRGLPALGKDAYVVDDLCWTVGAPQGKEFVIVVVDGPNANANTAIALMKETLKRRQ
ncbi:MAG: hypothetical protein V4792_10975 [Pseudomonadota bacterium]